MSLGESQIIPFRHQRSRQAQNGEEEMPRLSAEGGARYRKRALAMLLAAAALWIAIYAVAKLLFH
jgi:hypothetical protein